MKPEIKTTTQEEFLEETKSHLHVNDILQKLSKVEQFLPMFDHIQKTVQRNEQELICINSLLLTHLSEKEISQKMVHI